MANHPVIDHHRHGITLDFLGAAGTVTGSRFLVTTPDARVLVESGLFQGEKSLRLLNWQRFPVSASELDAVIITHAHLDHCGYLPRLSRQGFRGPVYCTRDTAALAGIVLRDSAHLQEEDAEHAARHGYSRHAPPEPLYDRVDADTAARLLRPIDFGDTTQVAPGVTTTMRPAGHILGSAVAHLDVDGHLLTVSGDLGRQAHPLLLPPAPLGPTHTLVVESTYGDTRHPAAGPEHLGAIVRRVLGRGGVVLMPAFAVDRTPVLLHQLQALARAGVLPDVPVYVDSPMALAALEVYRASLRGGAADGRPELADLPDLFDTGRVRLVADVEESRRLNDPGHPCVIISASGMATGGRVLHHLRHQLPSERNAVVLTGFQVPGTRGRALAQGAPALKIHGEYVPVRAEVITVPELSAHADADELLEWIRTAPQPPRTTYVVHGEDDAREALVAAVTDKLGWCAVAPRLGERVLLGESIDNPGW
ncbi:MAG: MBL fold metallo-hydrolase RNA specificity domain-containing protein [Nocardioidaceae bacterium]